MDRPPITDERLWELWRQAGNMHTVEVDLAFGRLVAEEAVKQEREACAKLCEDMPADPSIRLLCKAFADAIRDRSK